MSNEYEFIKTGNAEYIKTYHVYDGSGRITDIYEARANAADGHYALRTRYAYIGVTSRVEKTREEASTWSAAYDI